MLHHVWHSRRSHWAKKSARLFRMVATPIRFTTIILSFKTDDSVSLSLVFSFSTLPVPSQRVVDKEDEDISHKMQQAMVRQSQ